MNRQLSKSHGLMPAEIFISNSEPQHVKEEFIFQTTTNVKFADYGIIERTYTEMPYADFSFMSLGMERKELQDYINSLRDGSLFNQVQGMSLNYKQVFVGVSGDPSRLNNSNYMALMTSTADMELRYNLRVRFVKDDDMLVYYFLQLCNKLRDDVQPIWSVNRVQKQKGDELVNVMIGFNMIGKKNAKTALKAKHTLQNIVNAQVKDLMKINGWGRKRAQHVFDVCRMEYKEPKKKGRKRGIIER